MKIRAYLAVAGLLLSVGYFSVKHNVAQSRLADFRDAIRDTSSDALDSLRTLTGDPVVVAPALNTPAPTADIVDYLKDNIVKVLMTNPQNAEEAEKKVMRYFGQAYASGALDRTIIAVINAPELQPFLPQALTADKESAIRQLSVFIGAELEAIGAVPGVSGAEAWDVMSARHLKLAQASAFKPRKSGQPSLFSEPGFIEEFSALTGVPFTSGNDVKFLVNGPASFSKREDLIKRSKKSVYILTWAIYDDETGQWALDLLAAKKREGIDVKIMVDGKVSADHGKKLLPLFSRAGIDVIKFQDDSRKYDGIHCKVMVVDGETAIAGGMNLGNEYSHMGTGSKWRDTDVLATGSALAQFNAMFSGYWNEQVKAHSLPFATVPTVAGPADANGHSRISVVHQTPGQESYVFLGILKAIYGAATRINIENAYLVMMPALKTALLDARARGVEVNIYTNSAESTDEPILGAQILRSLPDMLAAGARVYLRRGSALHSKFLTIDGIFCNIGSFNLHPRSIRHEREMVVNILDRRKTEELDRIFRNDISEARRITSSDQLDIQSSLQHNLIRKYLFNQL